MESTLLARALPLLALTSLWVAHTHSEARAPDTAQARPDRGLSAWMESVAPELPLGLDFEPSDYAGRAHVNARSVALGRALFSEGRLSRTGRTSCATCHRPELALTDGRARALGDDGALGSRNTPSIVNRAFGRTHFWDGRAASLEEQALGPLLSPAEMGMTRELFHDRMSHAPDLALAFVETFGSEPTLELAARALAAFEATLVSGDSPFDRYEWLGDEGALTPGARAGLQLFRGKARCTLCHVGTNFTDEALHDLGVGNPELDDAGRPRRFRTPSLRNVAATPPYMHDGSFASLDEVLRFYEQGGGSKPGPDPKLHSFALTDDERGQLVAFLESLTGTIASLAPERFGPSPGVGAVREGAEQARQR